MSENKKTRTAGDGIEAGEEQKEITFDNLFKEYTRRLPDELIIEMINSVFHRDFDRNAKIARLDKESFQGYKKRVCDSYIAVFDDPQFNVLRVDEDFFHIEAQTANDGEMTLRIFEYAFRGASIHAETTSLIDGIQETKLKFPRSAVFYLKSDENTPRVHRMTLLIPKDDGTEDEISFDMPSVRIGDYTPTKLSDEHLYILLPFFPLKFARILENKHSIEQERQLARELDELKQIVGELAEREVITKAVAADILVKAYNMCQRMILGNDNIVAAGEVLKSMETMRETVVVNDFYGAWLRDTALMGQYKAQAEQAAQYKAQYQAQAAQYKAQAEQAAQYKAQAEQAAQYKAQAEQYKAQIEQYKAQAEQAVQRGNI